MKRSLRMASLSILCGWYYGSSGCVGQAVRRNQALANTYLGNTNLEGKKERASHSVVGTTTVKSCDFNELSVTGQLEGHTFSARQLSVIGASHLSHAQIMEMSSVGIWHAESSHLQSVDAVASLSTLTKSEVGQLTIHADEQNASLPRAVLNGGRVKKIVFDGRAGKVELYHGTKVDEVVNGVTDTHP